MYILLRTTTHTRFYVQLTICYEVFQMYTAGGEIHTCDYEQKRYVTNNMWDGQTFAEY